MDMWFWLVVVDFLVGLLAYSWGHWNGYEKGERDALERRITFYLARQPKRED